MQMAKVFYYGRNATFGDTKGHPGLIDSRRFDARRRCRWNDRQRLQLAVGVNWGPQAAQWVLGGNNAPFKMADPRIQTIPDPNDATKFLTRLRAKPDVVGRPADQAAKFAVGRIKKLTTDVGKGLTDALIGTLVSKFPGGLHAPMPFFATRRSIEQLRASRTATTATGREADVPVDWQGIPIIPTDAISNIETLAL
jgi:hypothetical protein